MATDDDEQLGGATARRIVLGAQLRQLREVAEVSRAVAAYQVRGSESKISRMELGRHKLKPRDIEDLLTLYGVHDACERANFLGQVEHSNEAGWWQRYADLTPKWLNNYLGLEESASRIQSYELQFVPGLLQTEAYARAVIGQGLPVNPVASASRRSSASPACDTIPSPSAVTSSPFDQPVTFTSKVLLDLDPVRA